MKKKKPGPKVMNKQDKKGTHGFSCKPDEYEFLQELAEKKGVTVSAVIRELIAEKRRKVAKIERAKGAK